MPIFRSVTRRLGASPAVLGTLPAFTLTDQRGQPFGTRELAGRVWVADFIFTSCQEACPLLSQKMAEVGRRARKLGPDFHLVSISVDPARDTPARLAEYGARYGANPIAWSFLTGPADAIEAAVEGGFKVGMGKEKVARRTATARATSGRSSTARTWSWSTASSASGATFPPLPRGSICWLPRQVGWRTEPEPPAQPLRRLTGRRAPVSTTTMIKRGLAVFALAVSTMAGACQKETPPASAPAPVTPGATTATVPAAARRRPPETPSSRGR